jgi:sulfopropanediol 3-dehydrogenase
MATQYLKRAPRTPATGEEETRRIVAEMLSEIRRGGEERARAYGVKLDGYSGDVRVSRETVEAASRQLPNRLKDDLSFAREKVAEFARRQRDSICEFETELSPGVWAGQRLIPIETAGCYVPGGRFAHVASAIMGITTAKVAGVANVIACSAPHQGSGIHPAGGSGHWPSVSSPARRPTSWWVPATGSSPRPSACCLAALESICSRVRRRS